MSSRQFRWMAGKVLDGAEYVIANSKNTYRILTDEWHFPDRRLQLLYPGVDTDRFVPAPRDAEVRTRLGWGERPVILTVGRLQKRKGHDRLIFALHQLRRQFPDVLYSIVGDGVERQNLEALVAREQLGDFVQFRGEPDDRELVQCYQQCDLFVLPNRQVGSDIEGFGMVLLEAQACGKAVVAGKSGGTAETMSIPETGQVVPCDTPDQLAELLIKLLGDKERLKQMGPAAREWAVERFDWAALSKQAAERFFGPEATSLKRQV